MTNSTENGSLRDRLGKQLNEKASLSWIAMLIVLVIAGIVLQAGNRLNSIPLALSSIPIAWILLRGLMGLQKLRWSDFGFKKPKNWLHIIGCALAGTILLHIVISFILMPLVIKLTGKPVDSSQFDLLRGNPLALLIGLLIVWTLAAFGEEMVFRGYIMHAFARPFKHKSIGWALAAFLTSILFGLGHSYQGITGVILTGVVGVLYALSFFLCERNLWVPILIHGLYDTSAFLIIYFNLDKILG